MGINANEQTKPVENPLTYGIWIKGVGWLKDSNNRYFADSRIEYARAALRMWSIGDDTPCRIDLIDSSMVGLQQTFLAREEQYYNGIALKKQLQKLKFKNSFVGRIIYGIFKRLHTRRDKSSQNR